MKLVLTQDGSHTLINEELGATYHSTHGALQESQVVFIQNGLDYLLKQSPCSSIRILEVGFGTGLNFLLTLSALQKIASSHQLKYIGIEKFPVPLPTIKELEFHRLPDLQDIVYSNFIKSHEEGKINLEGLVVSGTFELQVVDFDDYDYSGHKHNLIYYDAFGPGAQPQFWGQRMAMNLYSVLEFGGVLVTYCVQGDWRRHLKQAGFEVNKLPGPPGKREVMRAVKTG